MQWKDSGLLDAGYHFAVWKTRDQARRYRNERLGNDIHLARIVRVRLVIVEDK